MVEYIQSYLYEDQFLANAWAGKVKMRLPAGRFQKFAVAENGAVLLAGPTNIALARDGNLIELDLPAGTTMEAKLFSWRNDLFVMTDRQVFRLEGRRWKVLHEAADLTALGFRENEMFIGTKRGFYAMDLATGKETLARQTRLPVTHITCIVPDTNGVWAGTPRGLFHRSTSGEIRYYASKRWLADDSVIDIALDREGSVLALTKGGLSKIAFQKMTLAEKAMHYERKIRQRHMRYGLCSELRLLRSGDISSAEMIDTDNDGSWSAYYMASQAFRYAAQVIRRPMRMPGKPSKRWSGWSPSTA